ncbi:MAG: ArsR family transcriptional regulator [Archaeoglobales archaeon]|nr:MAG: ArsR family transcriptional regulator [Archaeoglobales archaeon]
MRRAKLVNDVVDLVPIMHMFSTTTYKRVYSALLNGWYTIQELREMFGDGVEEALKILKSAGMLEVRWRMPKDPAGIPEKEYHVTYTHLNASFYVSLIEFNKVLDIIFMPEDEFEDVVRKIVDEIRAGRMSVQHISRELKLDPIVVRAIAKRSLRLNLKGNIVEISKEVEV